MLSLLVWDDGALVGLVTELKGPLPAHHPCMSTTVLLGFWEATPCQKAAHIAADSCVYKDLTHLTRKRKLNWPGFGARSSPRHRGQDRFGRLPAC